MGKIAAVLAKTMDTIQLLLAEALGSVVCGMFVMLSVVWMALENRDKKP